MPLPANQSHGQRAIGTDGKVDEAGSVGEASRSCGADAGDGVLAGAALGAARGRRAASSLSTSFCTRFRLNTQQRHAHCQARFRVADRVDADQQRA